jgi:outer membrane beta-barrel protein
MNSLSKLFLWIGLFSVGISSGSEWDSYVDKKAPSDGLPIVVNRAVVKDGKFQVFALAGTADRQDLYSHYPISAAVRYHFSEQHAWEILKLNYDNFALTGAAQSVIRQTGYQVDAVQAYWSLSSGYIFTPVYGKYAFSESFLVHFEMYGGAAVGARFGLNQVQPMLEPLIGALHYLTPHFAILLPELRVRLYQEKRMSSTDFVSEVVVQAGVSWLF